ncbi:MAG: type IV pili methyl-accepting chemotaxis transducer N-terminal domain-containing protein [Pseudomonadota bacterium]
MLKHVFGITLALCLFIANFPAPLQATDQPEITQQQANEQLDQAGRQRMLSQRMAAASCLAMSGVDVDNQRAITQASWEEFDNFLVAIREGDPSKGWVAAQDTDVLAAVDRVDAIWSDARLPILQIAAGDLQLAVVKEFIAGSKPLLKRSDGLVRALSASFGEVVVDSSQVETIDIADRQRMLTQLILQQACLFAIGYQRDDMQVALEDSIDLFDRSLYALSKGDEQAGIMEPPTPELRAQLAYLMSIWDAYKSDLSQLVSDKKMNPTYMNELAEQSDVLLEGSNEVVKMYIGL